MSITIVPHDHAWRDAVLEFNRRMRDGGSKYGFYVDPRPTWIPRTRDSQPAWREFYLAVEDGREVRGAYALKPQRWWIRGREAVVTDWQGPFSEGAVSNRYGALGMRLLRDMLKKQPLLYSWGHGGDEEAIIQLLVKLQWKLVHTPFLFRVVRPRPFLLKNRYLRVDAKRRAATTALAYSGLGSLGAHAVHFGKRALSGKRYSAHADVVSELGSWADGVWMQGRVDYHALAVRDAESVNVLCHAHREWSHPVRLRVTARDGRDLGWAIVLVRQMEDHPRYGDIVLGTLVDYFARANDAGEVIHAAFDYLREAGADLVIANQSDPRWIRAIEDNGFLRIEGRRVFCAAPPLVEALAPFDETMSRVFLTNMDGHGPMGL